MQVAGPQLVPCPGPAGHYFPACIYFSGSDTVVKNQTNATILFELPSVGADVTLVWGNSTSYGYTALNSVSEPAAQFIPVFLNYLESNTTYYYKLTDHATNENPSTQTGSWAMGSDAPYLQSSGDAIIGTVYDDNDTPAIAGIQVGATCNFKSPAWSYIATTNSAGQYSIPVRFNGESDACQALGGIKGAGAYVVEVENGYCGIIGCNSPVTEWNKRWNETVIVWAPQVVNFYLPTVFISGYIPQITDFSNANTSNGLAGYSTVSYTTGTTYSTTETDCSTYLVVFGGCTSTSESITASNTYSSLNGNLFVSQQFWTSGDLLCDGMNRSCWNPVVNYYKSVGVPQFPAQQPITDWLAPSTFAAHSGYLLSSWGGSGSNNLGIPVYYQYPVSSSVTTRTTMASTGITELDFSLDVSYFGIGGGIAIADLS
ncbi:MAG: hypothetical protein WB778_06255 [Thermoplasmata archaeon]